MIGGTCKLKLYRIGEKTTELKPRNIMLMLWFVYLGCEMVVLRDYSTIPQLYLKTVKLS